jgi:GAF domain-containing protein
MIQRIWRYLTVLQYPYPNPIDRQQGRDILRGLSGFILLIVVGQYLPIAFGVFSFEQVGAFQLLLLPLALVVTFLLVQQGQLNWAKRIFIGALILAVGSPLADGFTNFAFFSLIVPLVLAGTLLSWRETLVVGLILAGIVFVASFAQPTVIVRIDDRLEVLLSILPALLFATLVFVVFGINPQSVAQSFSEEQRDLRQVLNAPQFQNLDLDEQTLLLLTIRNLRSVFGYPAVHIYLLDDQRRKATRYYTGFGLDVLQTGETLDVSSANAIGECLRTGMVVGINEASSPTRRRHLSAGLKAGLVVPLRYNDEVVGVLDIQAESDARFSETLIEAMLSYANRLGTALQRTRILKQLRDDISEQEKLIIKQRQRVRELEQAQQGVTSGWQTFFQQYTQGIFGYDVVADSGEVSYARDLPPALRMALEDGDLVVTQEEGHQVASLPVMLRDQLLGAMSFRFPQGVILTERQVELLRNVVQRLGLALENKRLFEQSQVQAQREGKANEVASVLLSSTDVEAVLQLASKAFNEALGAVNTQIYLQPQLDERKPEETS